MQLAASVLHSGEEVVWVDASHKISGARFAQILKNFKPLNAPSQLSTISIDSLLSRFTHFLTPTLAHLIALLSISAPSYLPKNTSLLVVDALSALTTVAFSRDIDTLSNFRKPGLTKPFGSKFVILQKLISSLQKLAATRNISVLVTLQCATKINPGLDPILVPAINSSIWDQGFGCRLVLYRHWGWDFGTADYISGFRFAKVIKAEGTDFTDNAQNIVGLRVLETGLISYFQPYFDLRANNAVKTNEKETTISKPPKRKLSLVDMEIPNSDNEDENYGWRKEDENELPPPPPQWQGSEDLLIGIMVDQIEDEDGRERLLDLENEEITRDLIEIPINKRIPIKKKIVIENSDSDDELA